MGSLHFPRAVGVAIVLLGVLLGAPARAELGSTGAVTLGVAVAAGIQPDKRACETAGSSRTFPSTGACIQWAGGVEGLLLWRGRVGLAFGVFSVAGQAAQAPQGQTAAAFPDRVSVPILVDFRPLSFLLSKQSGYLSRVMHGFRIALGPSVEIARTSADSSIMWGERIGQPAKSLLGAQFSLDGEVPLSRRSSGLSLRLSARVLYAPIVVLNGGAVQSAPVITLQTPAELASTFQGYASHVQIYLGLVYYL
jgi:hypothetical protein